MITKEINTTAQYWKIIDIKINSSEERVHSRIGLFQDEEETPTEENALVIRKYNFHISEFNKKTVSGLLSSINDLYAKIETMPEFN